MSLSLLTLHMTKYMLHFRDMKETIRNIGDDSRCEVHQTVLGIREGKEGWFHLYCPGGIACDDEGELYGILVRIRTLFSTAKRMRC